MAEEWVCSEDESWDVEGEVVPGREIGDVPVIGGEMFWELGEDLFHRLREDLFQGLREDLFRGLGEDLFRGLGEKIFWNVANAFRFISFARFIRWNRIYRFRGMKTFLVFLQLPLVGHLALDVQLVHVQVHHVHCST